MNFRFANIKINEFPGTKQVQVDADVFSKRTDNHYHAAIFFYGVEAGQKPSYNYSPVRVSCSCPSYYFYFSYWNKVANAHARRPLRPYTRKTADRPSPNPKQLPGLCKHLIALGELLLNSGKISVGLTGSASKDDKNPGDGFGPTSNSTPIDPGKKSL
jgi:hypothetical protein